MKLDLQGDRRRSGPTSTPRRSATTKERAKRLEALRRATRSSTRPRSRRWSRPACSALADMQLTDGGWGWFSGCGEHSSPHTTAVVVHGLQIAQAERRGARARHARARRRLAQELPGRAGPAAPERRQRRSSPYKEYADNLDALVYMVLVDAGVNNDDMRDFLYRDRTQLAVYAKAMFGLALHKHEREGQAGDDPAEHRASIVVQDDENQTAYLKLPDEQLLVVLVRQRDRGQRLLPQAARRGPTRRTRRRRGWSSTCSTTASTPPTGTAPATRPSASRPWPTTSRPAARTSPT